MIYKNPNRQEMTEERNVAYRTWIQKAMLIECDCFVIAPEMCAFINNECSQYGDKKCECECHGN
jgi:hypothetical protein